MSVLTESNISSKTVIPDKSAIYSVAVTESAISEQEDFTTSNTPVPNSPAKRTELEEAVLVTNGVVQTTKETALCTNVKNNEREPLLSLQGAFKQHLVFPVAQDKKKETKERLPSAISGEAWREYYNKKENEAKRKLDKKQKRKEERELRKDHKKAKTGKGRKNVVENQGSSTLKKKKIHCSLCDDELVSDAEEEAERNIGCDFCPRWYHLYCTELSDLPYAMAAEREYKCSLC